MRLSPVGAGRRGSSASSATRRRLAIRRAASSMNRWQPPSTIVSGFEDAVIYFEEAIKRLPQVVTARSGTGRWC